MTFNVVFSPENSTQILNCTIEDLLHLSINVYYKMITYMTSDLDEYHANEDIFLFVFLWSHYNTELDTCMTFQRQ